MRRLLLGSVLFGFSLLGSACGYFSSGTWEDDPQNWKRAWGTAKPEEVVMPHSWFWRSAHWSREDAYFFQVRWNEDLFKQLIEGNGMRPAGASEKPGYCVDKPGWFTPPSAAGYESWRCGPSADCRLFRERGTKELFLYMCQL
ncbi:MAG: hypothetical protein ACJ75H_24770 [Thermoanaerobaculia bacterium]